MGVYDTRGNYSPTPGVCRPNGPAKPPPEPRPPEHTWENQPPRTLYKEEIKSSCLVGVRFLWSNGECLVGCPWGLTQEDGQVIRGTLDSKSFLSQVIEGRAHRIRLNPQFDPKAQLGGIRAELQEILHEILAAERVEADRLTAIQAQRSAVANGFYAQIALGRGFLYGAWGLVESGLEFADLANPFDELAQAAVAAWKSEPEPGKGWLDSFQEQYTAAQYRDLAAALGFDPATISREKMAQAYEAANYIFEDAASKRALRDFAAEYVSLQNHESILQFTGGMVFEIVLAALLVFLTGGTGLAARASVASTRLTPLLTRLGETLGKLGANLKKARVYEAGIAEGKGSGSQTVVIPQAKGITPARVSKPPTAGILMGAANALIDPRKITGYALNKDHVSGGPKARVFESALGFTIENADELIRQLHHGVRTTGSTPGVVNDRGARFRVDILVKGPKREGIVRTGWIYDPGSSVPRLTTLFVR
ncbi:DUF6883 domain-containing protein [Pseudomonas viridiflava]|uniref:DUF6883 domain-containing protein n=1 Tax=Pseudomonas viridiflava TaxID=33069 RepID=UPI0013C2BD5E|nr:DUF6883 domain-containing protein [Pseudomonas viridiflava]MEE4157799.1 hypothetical protein [Pseudomonas viridiflava]QXG24307.1 hypothetical protein KTT56_21335 [Pseudomonas viridiflava]WKW33452.1 hypothetical protein KIH13_06300 [Pseudomonas viridiflava]